MSHLRIFDNPKGKWFRAGQFPPLTLDGAFPTYTPEIAYEGRVQIVNAQGECSVQLLSSSNLPNGYELAVDQDTMEVVLTWPAYEAAVTESIPNPGLEAGNVGWDLGAGLEIGTWNWEYDGDDNDLQAYDGVNAIEYHAGSRGNSRAMMRTPRLLGSGVSVTASCQVQQGPSAENNTGGWVLLQFLNASGEVIAEHEGNHVDSGSNAAWHPSSVTATSPIGTTHVRIGAECYRKKESKPMWIDTFEWNLAVDGGDQVGTNTDDDVSICLRVTDAAGRTADGCYTITTALDFDALMASLNPIAWWKLQDTGGGTAAVEEINGHNGIYGGNYVKESLQLRQGGGPAAYFGASGSSGRVEISVPAAAELDFDYTREFTMFGIGRLDDYTGAGTVGAGIWLAWDDPNLGYANAILQLAKVAPNQYQPEGHFNELVTHTSYGVYAGSLTDLDNIHFWTLTYDPDVIDAPKFRFYIDGALVNTADPGGISHAQHPATYMRIAGDPSYGGSYQFIGHLSDVALFRRRLTDSEILALWNAGHL